MEGIININKPSGISSFDVIRVLRKTLKEKRIGHTGTLDPLATGVLIICVGKATRLAQDIEGYSKVYVAELELGYKTDTYDIEGSVTEKSSIESVAFDEFKNVVDSFVGHSKQLPPMYSAIKINGQKLYELARKGIEVERKTRDINIDFIEIVEFDGKKAKIRCKVSKGTYIRSLIYDIGEKLGTFATMTSLVREKVGDIDIANAFSLEEIENLHNNNREDFLWSVEKFFDYPKLILNNERDLKLFSNGNTVRFSATDGRYRIYNGETFIGLANVNNNLLKGYKYF